MRAYNKEDIKNRFENSSIKPSIKIKTLDKPIKLHKWELDKVLEIIIPGNPESDSRPKHRRDGDFFYNPHLANGIKLMKEVFDRCDPDRTCDIVIKGPIVSEINAYICANEQIRKLMTADELDDVRKEILPCSTEKKDSDNIEKLWWDCMGKFNIIILDEFICRNITEKFYTLYKEKERIELRFYYTDKDTFPSRYLETLKEYFKYTLTMKYKKLNNIRDDLWHIIFFKNIANFYTRYKGKINSDSVKEAISKYSAEELKLFGMEGTRKVMIDNILKDTEIVLNEVRKRKGLIKAKNKKNRKGKHDI